MDDDHEHDNHAGRGWMGLFLRGDEVCIMVAYRCGCHTIFVTPVLTYCPRLHGDQR